MEQGSAPRWTWGDAALEASAMVKHVSIVIPVFNSGGHLAEAIQSALAQTMPCEVICVDDGSTDPVTLQLLDQWSARGVNVVRHHENLGVAAALNTGCRAAQAPVLLPLGADDWLDPTMVEKCVRALNRPGIGVVTPWVHMFGAEDWIWRDVGAPNGLDDLLFDNPIPGASMVRRQDFDVVGGFREELTWGEDYDFWIRVLSTGLRCAVVPEPLYHYRRHTASLTSTTSFETKLQQELRIVELNRQVWAARVVQVMERSKRQDEKLRSLRRRWGRINRVADTTLDRADKVRRLLRRLDVAGVRK